MTTLTSNPDADNLVIDPTEHRRITNVLSHEVPINTGWKTQNKISFEPEEKSRIYVDDGYLCIENLAKLPLDRCIKTNQSTDRIIKLHLRNPYNPATWWGKQSRRLTFGISNQAWNQHRKITAISWVLVGIAALSFCCLVWSPLYLLVSLIVFSAGSMLRSISPIQMVQASKEFTMIKGISPEFGEQFDQYKNGEPLK